MSAAIAPRRRAAAPKRAQPARPRKQTEARSSKRPTPAPRPLPGPREGTVGVRELRQNLSVYLTRIKQGESLEVTEHGHVVAVLVPVPPKASRYDILLAQGRITPARRSIRDLPPPRKAPPGTPPMSQILDELREDRF